MMMMAACVSSGDVLRGVSGRCSRQSRGTKQHLQNDGVHLPTRGRHWYINYLFVE